MRKALVIDTSIIFDVLRQRETVAERLVQAMQTRSLIYLCPFVDFEVRRGLLHRPAPQTERMYYEISDKWHWQEIDRGDWNLAAQFWADCESSGTHAKDADLMIAAFALNRGAKVITADRGFENLPVATENWRAED